ncbi:MAG TPA: response regulator [Ktedonobacteraceae bacterium]|jgi:DNA-binding response OmpR family regulator|nr:response regulator [Ktedonobacteraceae bacterium]
MALRIVVIEDDSSIQDLYRLLLETEGYHVIISSTPHEDATAVAALHPDLIILDLLIGRKQNGWHLLQQLKNAPLTASIPVLIVTAAVNFAQEWKEFIEFHNIPVVSKPFNIDDILALVKQLLANTPDAIS